MHIDYVGDGAVIQTRNPEATDWARIPITVPECMNGKNES